MIINYYINENGSSRASVIAMPINMVIQMDQKKRANRVLMVFFFCLFHFDLTFIVIGVLCAHCNFFAGSLLDTLCVGFHSYPKWIKPSKYYTMKLDRDSEKPLKTKLATDLFAMKKFPHIAIHWNFALQECQCNARTITLYSLFVCRLFFSLLHMSLLLSYWLL